MKSLRLLGLMVLCCVLVLHLVVAGQCDDGIDNNDDGYTDYDGADPACVSDEDASEIAYGFQLSRDPDMTGACVGTILAEKGETCVADHYQELSWYIAHESPVEDLQQCLVLSSDEYYGITFDDTEDYTYIALADCVYQYFDDFTNEVESAYNDGGAELQETVQALCLLTYGAEFEDGACSGNTAPTVDSVRDIETVQYQDVFVEFSASDDDGDVLSYTLSADDLEAAATSVSLVDDMYLSVRRINDEGVYTVTIEVSDGVDTTDITFTITVDAKYGCVDETECPDEGWYCDPDYAASRSACVPYTCNNAYNDDDEEYSGYLYGDTTGDTDDGVDYEGGCYYVDDGALYPLDADGGCAMADAVYGVTTVQYGGDSDCSSIDSNGELEEGSSSEVECDYDTTCDSGYYCSISVDDLWDYANTGSFTSTCTESSDDCAEDDSGDDAEDGSYLTGVTENVESASGFVLADYHDYCLGDTGECDPDSETCDTLVEYSCASSTQVSVGTYECGSDVGSGYTCLYDDDGYAYCGTIDIDGDGQSDHLQETCTTAGDACTDGVCNQYGLCNACTDDDGGYDVYTTGSITGVNDNAVYAQGTDYCRDVTGKMVEYWCGDSDTYTGSESGTGLLVYSEEDYCPDNFACDTANDVCFGSAGTCSSTDECSDGYACGDSTSTCDGDSDGDGTTDVDAAAAAAEICSDADCGGYVCEDDDGCYTDCEDGGDNACSGSLSCNRVGDYECIEPSSLADGEECTAALFCSTGSCTDDVCGECTSSDTSNCGTGYKCNTGSYACYDNCKGDSYCDGSSGYTCNTESDECVEDGSLSFGADCSDDDQCKSGNCRSSDNTCRFGGTGPGSGSGSTGSTDPNADCTAADECDGDGDCAGDTVCLGCYCTEEVDTNPIYAPSRGEEAGFWQRFGDWLTFWN